MEAEFGQPVYLKLTSGTAEVFGTELAKDTEYEFQGRKVAVFSWTGCTLMVKGTPITEYTAGETPMASYLNAHLALELVRADAHESQGYDEEHRTEGPRVLIVGPSDSGKTSLTKILLNYAIKEGRSPLFVDIDPGEGTVTVPGSLSATPLVRPLDVEDEFSATPLTSSTAPFVVYHGYPRPGDHGALYKAQVGRLAEVVEKKVASDVDVRTSGFIINSPSQFTESLGKELMYHAIRALRASVILVIGDERLYSELSRNASKESHSVSVVKLAKSGGVVNRDAKFRKQLEHRAVREYFYGTKRSEISAYSTPIVFTEMNVRRVGEIAAYLTLGAESRLSQTRMVRVDPGDALLNSVLALTSVEAPPPGDKGEHMEDEDKIAVAAVAGFAVV
ncbi:Clp1-domain-containing protein [Gonapodya prolifera JEL478]|uniref:Polynucleotide 5'-hydroxyl-kinase GRC3 n=1 Tax=Gonapodya prolifera (strain JEL478) TaxID=1344416 RepID=A0A139ATS9_GONPJ|nr:Clp1-domain-containing protein [Gonapodya prolifera JEL478]|eukprot:KXS20132.1 Clp1-domain-containing protein [Gonapodya prolifera JEL478]